MSSTELIVGAYTSSNIQLTINPSANSAAMIRGQFAGSFSLVASWTPTQGLVGIMAPWADFLQGVSFNKIDVRVIQMNFQPGGEGNFSAFQFDTEQIIMHFHRDAEDYDGRIFTNGECLREPVVNVQWATDSNPDGAYLIVQVPFWVPLSSNQNLGNPITFNCEPGLELRFNAL